MVTVKYEDQVVNDLPLIIVRDIVIDNAALFGLRWHPGATDVERDNVMTETRAMLLCPHPHLSYSVLQHLLGRLASRV